MGTPAADVLKPDFAASQRHFIFTEEHDRLRESIHAFVTKELAPHALEWEESTFPDSVFPRMGELGLLGLSYPEEYGGQGGDYFCNLVLAEEMVHSKSGGLAMGVAVLPFPSERILYLTFNGGLLALTVTGAPDSTFGVGGAIQVEDPLGSAYARRRLTLLGGMPLVGGESSVSGLDKYFVARYWMDAIFGDDFEAGNLNAWAGW